MYSLDQLLGNSSLRPPSHAALSVLRLIGRGDYDRSQLTKMVRRDPAMAASILKAAAQPANAAKSIDAAIGVLGEERLERVLVHLALSSLKVETLDSYEMREFGFWRSSLATAHATEWMAHRLGLEPGLMYVTGLLLDIGKVLLDPVMSASLWTAEAAPEAVEEAAAGTTHADLGSALLESWKIGEPMVSCVRYHHTPAETAEHQREVACCHVASWCTQWLGEPMGLDALRYPLDEAAAANLGIDEEDLRQLALAVVRGLNSEP